MNVSDIYLNILGEPKWQVSKNGTECLSECSGRGGRCSWCGQHGYCCSLRKSNQLRANGDCTIDHLVPLMGHFDKTLTAHHI